MAPTAQIHRVMGERRKRTIEWQVIRLRSRGEYLGVVQAPDDEAAVKAALKALALDNVACSCAASSE